MKKPLTLWFLSVSLSLTIIFPGYGQGTGVVALETWPLHADSLSLRLRDDPQSLRWIFVSPREVASEYLPRYLTESWTPLSGEDLRSALMNPSLTPLLAALRDSLSLRKADLEKELAEILRERFPLQLNGVSCALFYHPSDERPLWAGAGRSLAFSIRPYLRAASDSIQIDWDELRADLLCALYRLMSSEVLTQGDLLLESTGNHAAIREDLITRYGFGFVSLASRVLGPQHHQRDPALLREIIDDWAENTMLDVVRASRAAEFFRQIMRLGMASWAASGVRGIPDSAIYLYQLRQWLPRFEDDVRQFHKAFNLVVVEKRVSPEGPLRQLVDAGVLERLGFYMARRIEYVLGRERLLKDFATHEVEFFLDYIALQEEADLKYDENVCFFAFDLANELDRLTRLAERR